MTTSCNDRSKAAQLERIRALSPRQKLELVARVSQAAREIQKLGQSLRRGRR